MNEVKKFVEDVREEERRKQEEREMEERRAVASLKIQVWINCIEENFPRIIKLQIIILILVMVALRGQRPGQSKLVLL